MKHLTRSQFWSNLVELDIRDNGLTSDSVAHLIDAPESPELTRITWGGNRLSDEMRNEVHMRWKNNPIILN